MADLRESLSGFWETINDKSWPLLDAVHIGEFFDEHNIPPVLFPIAIVAIILLLLMASAGGPQPVCGDEFCDPSEEKSGLCPTDCEVSDGPQVSGKRVIVSLDRTPSCELTVRLYAQNGELVTTQRGTKDEFVFDGIDQESVYVEIFGSSSQSQRTLSTSIQEDENTLSVTLSSTICESQQSQNGVLRLSVKDASTGTSLNGVTVSISELENGFSVNNVISNAIVNGLRDFPLPSGKPYAIYAEKVGYEPYDGTSEQVMVSATTPASKAISLTPQATGPSDPDTGDLEVCVKNGTMPVTSGIVVVQGVSDSAFLLPGDLSEIDPLTEPSAEGCYVFEGIPAGKLVSVSMPNAPAGCIPTASPSSVEIAAGGRRIVILDLNCQPSDVAYLKIKVLGDGNQVLTQNATITMWTEDADIIPGSGLANSLAIGSGGYTEEVTAPSDESLYVWARGLPLGYLDYRSELIDLSSGEHRALTIYLNYTQPTASSLEFTFSGVAVPSPVAVNQQFQATVSEITFDQTELTGTSATLTATMAGSACGVVYDGAWRANCTAPNTTGEHNLLFSVNYDGKTGTNSMPVEVRRYAPGFGLITITSLFSTHEDPPLGLYYDIQFKGDPVTNIVDQRMEVTYVDSPRAYAGEISDLVQEDQYWTLDANVPFKGDYRLRMYIEVFENGTFYNTTYTATFSAKSNSDGLSAQVYIAEKVLNVLESFDVELILSFEGTPIQELEVLELYMEKTFYSIPWVRGKRLYALQLAAPSYEACILDLAFLIKGESIAQKERVHVIDTSKTKSALCPLERQAPCDSIEDVRRCLFNHDSKTAYYPEQQLSVCITSGCSYAIPPGCPTSNKGDLAMDCFLDEDDVALAEEYLTTITSQADRNVFAPCMDMDNDGDVDRYDLLCLRNVAATKWYGDIGEESAIASGGTCPTQMRGGFCFDMDTDTILPGDLEMDGKLNKDDELIMSKIILAVGVGVTPHEDILAVADFDQDSTVDPVDMDCLKRFYAINFDTGEVATATGQIPPACLAIFNLQCTGTKGDMNADGEVTEIDYVIVQFIANGQLTGYPEGIFTCADVNSDGIVNEDDVLCMRSFLTGDREDWLICLDCQGNMPPDAYGAEICGDGYDNDCDGEKDPDICRCSDETPCNMKMDSDGGTSPGISDGNYKLCRDLSWDHTGYRWVSEGQISCASDRQCETVACKGSTKTCSSEDGSEGKWFSGELPGEKCGDGWDNDCEGGDKKCKSSDGDSCFPAGTPITMADGSVKNIEDVGVGDVVLGYDLDAKATVPGLVLELESPIRYHLYTLIFENGDTLRLTSEHPLYARGKGWASMDPEATYEENGQAVLELGVGDEILTISGDWLRIADVTYQDIPEGVRTYNLKAIEGHSNFFAGGFLAHNKW